MKNKYILILLVFIGLTSFAQEKDNIFKKEHVLKQHVDLSTAIFEGRIISKNKSFLSIKDNQSIYTSYTFQVDQVLLGNLSVGSVEIILPGGQVEVNGEGRISESSHTGLCSGNAIFFSLPFTEGSSSIVHTNKDVLTTISIICYNPDGSINSNPYHSEDSYLSRNELYKDLRQYRSITIPKEKKSPDVNRNKIKSNESSSSFNYEQNVKNYNTNFKLLLDKIKTAESKASKQVSANEITFRLANQTITGNNSRYFEFDITAEASTNSLYFDGALFRLSYNTSAFGSEIVKNNKITITKSI